MNRKPVKDVAFRISLTLLLAFVCIEVYVNSRRLWTLQVEIRLPIYNFSDAVNRCKAIRQLHSQPAEGGSLNADQLVKELTPSCQRTAAIDALDLLELCNNGRRPLLVSNKFRERTVKNDGKDYRVPNVVHYIYGYPLAEKDMPFLMYISMLSVHRFIQPRYVFIHGDALPRGDWWRRTTADVENIFFVNISSNMPSHVFGKKLKKPEHVADILRLEVIYTMGGIYLDTDVIVLRSFDALRNFAFTLGRDSPAGTPNLIMVGQPCPEFVLHWIDGYRDFNPDEWASHASYTPNSLATGRYAHLIHIEADTMATPYWDDFDRMFKPGVLYDWSRQYSTHVWKRVKPVPSSPDEIKQLNTTLGQMMRHVYYGTIDVVK